MGLFNSVPQRVEISNDTYLWEEVRRKRLIEENRRKTLEAIREFERLQIQEKETYNPILYNEHMLKDLSRNQEPDFGIVLKKLPENTVEFLNIKKIFNESNKKFYKVDRILKIDNPLLLMQYNLKKEEAIRKFRFVEEKIMFHGTKEINIDSICKFNFDWRLRGISTGHRYGKGVSFTPISYYATHYCDLNKIVKVMIVAKVLIVRCINGSDDMVVPPDGYDTSMKENGQVFVKYDDNSYIPQYLIYFTGEDFTKKKFSNNRRRSAVGF